MADLKSYEVEECRASFEVYDTTGGGKIDAFYMGPLLRAMDVVVTEETVKKAGCPEKLGMKMIDFEEFLPIYSELKKSKDVGLIEDLLEGLKVYDKNENGTMMAAELAHVLLSLGEKVTDAQIDDIFTACCPPEDEDGYVKYENNIVCLITSFYRVKDWETFLCNGVSSPHGCRNVPFQCVPFKDN